MSNQTALEKIATQVVQNVCELPDYNSPEDQPNLVMCTVEELHRCVMRALEDESERDSQPTAPASNLVSFDSLPLGARFRYPGKPDVFVKIENGGEGTVAEWKGPILRFMGQGIYTFAESEAQRKAGMVELAEQAEPAVETSGDREARLIAALEMFYDKYEDGDSTYEDPDACSGYLGKCIKLSTAEENQILELIPEQRSSVKSSGES